MISTDPRFINHHSGFSTQHLLSELRLTTHLPRCYGDSFYEQQRLRDQVIQLTGQRFLPGYQSDVQQQQALVTQGLAAAKALQLTPGKALTAAQQAQLTTAIVWPVAKPVTLANGQTTQVLDLQLYTPRLALFPTSDSALIAASEIQLTLKGELRNSGTLTANHALSLTAKNIHNQLGTVYSDTVSLIARQDVHQGGNLGGASRLQVQAGRDFTSKAETLTSNTSDPTGHSMASRTTLGLQPRMLALQPGAVMDIQAGRDVNLAAAQVLNVGDGGYTRFSGGRHINLEAVQSSAQDVVHTDDQSIHQGNCYEQGSQIKAVGDVHFQAGHSFNAVAAQVTSGAGCMRITHTIPTITGSHSPVLTADTASRSGPSLESPNPSLLKTPATGSLRITAGHNIEIRDGQASSYSHRVNPYHTSSAHNQAAEDNTHLTVDGSKGTLEITAQQDVNLVAARINHSGSEGKTVISAGHDITLGALQNQHQQAHQGLSTRPRLRCFGAIVSCSHSMAQDHSRDVGSQLKVAGDIDFQAGRNFDSTAAQVTSGIQLDHPGAPRLTEASSRAITATGCSEDSLVAADSTATPPLATGSLRIRAGNHIDIRAGQGSYYYQRQWGGSRQETSENSALKQEAGLAVQAPQGELQIAAAQDLNLSAVQIGNAGAAGRHLTLGTMNTGQQQSHIQSADNFLKQRRSAEVGTEIQTVGDLQCRAGENFQATAAQVSSQAGALQVAAGAQLDIRSGYATQDYDEATKQTKRGFLKKKTIHTRDIRHQTMALGSNFSGRQVEMVAGEGDLQIQGSNVVGEHGTTLIAQEGSVKITSTENRHRQISTHQEEKSGLFSNGGLSFTLGEQETSQQQQLEGTQQQSSAVGSLLGDVQIWAKQGFQQRGSHLVAPQGNIEVSAASLDILDTHNQQQLTQESSSYSSGFTVGVTNPALSAAQTARQLESAASQTSDPRMQALAAAAGGLAAKNSYDAIKTNPQQLGGVNASLSYGQSESHSESRQSHRTAQRSQVVARNITIKARTGDAMLQGDIQAAEQTQITASGQLKLLASENRSQQQSEQSSSSSSIGVGIGTHSGPAVTVSLSLAEESSHGESGSYNLTQVSAGQKVVLQSGGDTLLQGEIRAPQIQGKVGGNLTIESLQDTDHQEGQQESLSVSLSGGCGHVSGSLNVNQSDYRSDFASVRQQAGIKAGDGGFQLQVGGNTHLEGAVIASSDKAIAAGCNQLETSTLTQHAIENRADYEAQSIGLGGGFSRDTSQPQQPALPQNGVGTDQQGQAATGALQVPGSQLPSQHGLSATIPIVMNASDSASSTTYSGISGAGQAVKITNKAAQQALTSQNPEQAIAGLAEHAKDGSNALAPIFNREEIEAGFQIVGALTREVGTFLENRVKEQTQAQKALKEEQAKAPAQQDSQRIGQLQQTLQENQTWEMGGKGRILLSALTLAAGSTGQMLQATAVNVIQSYGAQQIKLIADSMNSEAARTALQGLLAGAGAAAQGQNATAAALGASASVVLNNLIESAYGEPSHQLTAEERQARKNLVTTLITGTTQALGGDAALANAAATIEMENNYLSQAQWSQRNQELSEGENLLHNAAIRAKWDLIDTGQDASFAAGVIAGVPTTLYEAVEGIVNAALSPHETYLSLKSLFDSDNVLGSVSAAVKQSYIARLDKMDAEFERAGARGSFNAGLETTKFLADITSLAAGGIGVAKGGVALTNFGIKTAQQGIQSAKTIRGVATAAKQGTTAIVPKVSSQVAGVSDKLTAGNPLSKAGHVAAKPPGISSAVAMPTAQKVLPEASRGADNVATYPKLKKQLKQENLTNIAKHDPRLEAVVKGGTTTNPNFSIGSGTRAEADRLGILWVGDGARLVTDQKACPGCWVSTDNTRIYRPPNFKPNIPVEFNPTGIQANFVQQLPNGTIISNGHLVIKP